MSETKLGTLACDLDGTLAEQQVPFNPYSVGPPVLDILHKVRAEIAKGRHVVCFTARASSNDTEMWRTVRAWLDEQGLYGMRITNTKTPDISEIWDDRARQVLNGEVVKAASAHCTKNTCPGCGSVSTCRCSKPITNFTEDLCDYCKMEAEGKEVGDLPWRRKKKASASPRTLLHYVPNTALEDVRKHGLLSSVALMQRPDLLAKARPDAKERADWLEFASKQKDRAHRQGPNALFQGPPSTLKLPDNHPSKSVATTQVRILIDQLLKDHPTTRLHGLELLPYKALQDGLSDDAWDAKWESFSKAQQDEQIARRKRDLTPAEFDALTKKTPEELWKHYTDPGKPMYAPDVPHVAVITPTGTIDPKYLDFGDPSPPAESDEGRGWIEEAEKQAAWDAAADEVRGWFREPEETKSASTAAPPTTGPGAIMHALKNIDLDALEKQAHALIATGKLTKRDQGIKMLGVIDGMKRNELKPTDLMITKVPVLPPAFRPYGMMGNTYLPGVANELYGDMFKHIGLHKETLQELGPKGAVTTRRNMYDSVRALFGYGDPVSPKLHARGNVGYMKQITGPGSPKFSFAQRRMFSKTQDNVARGAITMAPHLNMNQIGIPKEMAWDMLHNIIQGRLARGGMSPMQALEAVRGRSREADIALQQEIKERPFIYSRAPAWHQFNTVAGYGQLIDGDNIAISPYVTAGLNADFDGDTINLHVPVLPESVQEAKDKLMPDKMLFSIKSPDQVMAQPKHEQILGLFESQRTPSKQVHKFGSHQEALAAIQKGTVSLSDDIDYPD